VVLIKGPAPLERPGKTPLCAAGAAENQDSFWKSGNRKSCQEVVTLSDIFVSVSGDDDAQRHLGASVRRRQGKLC
jgi:hypothetical protein